MNQGSVRSTGHFNGLKTMLLFSLMWAFLLGVGWLIANSTNQPMWIWIMAALGLLQTAYVYWNSATLALRSMRAYPVSEQQAPELYAIVRELSEKANQPMPGIYVAPTSTPNAFATGRNPRNAAVCCTEGILALLDERELRGVLGHELMHVYNRDILTSSIASAMAGIITSLAQMFFFMGGGMRDERNNNPLSGIMVLFLLLLAPLGTALLRLAISRTREYDADEDGARLTEDPLALASALKKLHGGIAADPLRPSPRTEQVAAVMIANPFGRLRNVMSTHPPMEKRIARLEKMAGY